MNIREIYKLPLKGQYDTSGNLISEGRKELYGSTDVSKVIIDGITFTGYKTYTFYWEKTYGDEPERSISGVINDLNSMPFFVTPRLRLNFSMMSIDDYRAFYQLIMSRNEHLVTCYDVVNNNKITCKMYVEPDDFPTIYMVARKIQSDNTIEKWQEITGIRDYVITMNGTNDDVSLYSVVYNSNPPSTLGVGAYSDGAEEFQLGDDIIIGRNSSIPKETFNGKYNFVKWGTSSGDEIDEQDGYSNGIVAKITQGAFGENNRTITLYAKWLPKDTFTLNYNYNLSSPEILNGKQRLYDSVKNGDVITLPNINSAPEVIYEGAPYYPYENGDWYTSPIKASGDSNKLTSPYKYNKTTDSTIYCLYDTRSYPLTYDTKSDKINLYPIKLKYGETIPKPILYLEGKTFLGWFWEHADENNNLVEQQFTKTTMPPYESGLTIYAKWEDNK